MLMAVVASAGCGVLPESECSLIGLPTVRANIRDAVTGDPAAQYATLIIRSGTYADSATTDRPGELELTAGEEQPGTYDLLVRKSGYVDWQLRAVTVSHDECHVKTETLTVMLKPS